MFLNLLLVFLFRGNIAIGCFILKIEISDLNTLKCLLQALEIFFKSNLITNEEGNEYLQEMLDQILMATCVQFDVSFLKQDNIMHDLVAT